MYLSSQSQMNQKKRVVCEFEMDFKKSFCGRSNLSNGGIWNHFTVNVEFHHLTKFSRYFSFSYYGQNITILCQGNPRDLLCTVFNYLFPYLKPLLTKCDVSRLP